MPSAEDVTIATYADNTAFGLIEKSYGILPVIQITEQPETKTDFDV